MSTETKDLVMIMSLRDQISKDLKRVTANLEKMKKLTTTETKATTLQNAEWKKATSSLKNYIVGVVGVGSAMGALIGVSKELISTSQQVSQTSVEAQFAVGNLGQSAVDSYNKMKPYFTSIGAPFLATASQVDKAYGIITKASGKTSVAMKDLQGTFALAKVTGVSFATVAEDVGESLRGNQEALRDLIGPYGYKGLSEAEQAAIPLAQKSYTAWNQLGFQWRSLLEGVANPNQPQSIEYLASQPGAQGSAYKNILANMRSQGYVSPHAEGGIVSEPTAMIGLNTGKRGIMAEAGPEAIVPTRGGGAGRAVVFNLYATVADRNTLRAFVQQITPLLQQNNRRGSAGAATYGD